MKKNEDIRSSTSGNLRRLCPYLIDSTTLDLALRFSDAAGHLSRITLHVITDAKSGAIVRSTLSVNPISDKTHQSLNTSIN